MHALLNFLSWLLKVIFNISWGKNWFIYPVDWLLPISENISSVHTMPRCYFHSINSTAMVMKQWEELREWWEQKNIKYRKWKVFYGLNFNRIYIYIKKSKVNKKRAFNPELFEFSIFSWLKKFQEFSINYTKSFKWSRPWIIFDSDENW